MITSILALGIFSDKEGKNHRHSSFTIPSLFGGHQNDNPLKILGNNVMENAFPPALKILILTTGFLVFCSKGMAASPPKKHDPSTRIAPLQSYKYLKQHKETDYTRGKRKPSLSSNLGIFARNYYGIGLGRNYPRAKGRESLSTGYYHPILYYKYNSEDSWMMGLSAQFKVFRRRETEGTSMLSIAQQTMRIFRIYHPTYFQVGTKLIYLLPARRPKFPVQKDSHFEIEIGAALAASVTLCVQKNLLLNLNADIWRGTKTRRLQAIEFGLSIDYFFNAP